MGGIMETVLAIRLFRVRLAESQAQADDASQACQADTIQESIRSAIRDAVKIQSTAVMTPTLEESRTCVA